MSLQVEVYIDKYDIQSEPIEIPEEMTQEDWEKTKQTLITDFVDKFGVHFKKKKKYDFDTFGYGTYVDNEMNRRLRRVGQNYDRAIEYKATLERILRNRNINIKGRRPKIVRTEELVKAVKGKKWQSSEENFIKRMRELKEPLSFVQIAKRLGRTPKAIYSHRYKAKKKRITLVKTYAFK